MAARRTLLMAILLLSAAAAYVNATTAAAAAGDDNDGGGGGGGEVARGEDHEGPAISLPAGEYGRCLPGCPGGLYGCDEPCKKAGYGKGGECVASVHQCCCFGPLPA